MRRLDVGGRRLLSGLYRHVVLVFIRILRRVAVASVRDRWSGHGWNGGDDVVQLDILDRIHLHSHCHAVNRLHRERVIT